MPAASRGRGRPRGGRSTSTSQAPTRVPKRSADTDDEYTAAEKPTKKKKVVDPLPLRSPSKRSTRNLDPAGLKRLGPARRSPEEVAREAAAKAQAQLNIEFAKEVAIRAMAALQVTEDAAAALEQDDAILSISDVEGYTMDVDAGSTRSMTAPLEERDPSDPEMKFFEVDDADFAPFEDDEAYHSEDPFTGTAPSKLVLKVLNQGCRLI